MRPAGDTRCSRACPLAMVPAEVAVSRGLPARRRRNWRRAIVLRFDISGPLHAWVMSTSIVSPSGIVIFLLSLIGTDCSELLRVAVVERPNALQPVRRFEYFSMTQSVDGVAVSGEPVLFHRPPGELVIHGTALIFLCAINQLNDVADLFIRLGAEQLHLRKAAQLIGKPLEQGREGDA